MNYLSPQIAAFARKKNEKKTSLIKEGNSCGIFQDYDQKDFSEQKAVQAL